MNPLDQQVARRLTRFYGLPLTLIAGLTVSGLLLVNHTIRRHYADGRVLNVTGRQRMLSQRLTKLALLRISGLPAADTVPFPVLLRTWRTNHAQLRTGTLRMEKPYGVQKSPPLDSMLTRIEPVFRTIYRNYLRIGNPSSSPAGQRAALAVVLRAEPAYLRQMDAIVFRFDAESFDRVKALERTEWLLATATLLTVLLEGLFVFRPVVRHTRRVVRRLTESETALQRANEQLATSNDTLAVTNAELVRTQAELLRAHDEKHRLQLAEDRVRSAALLEGQEEERRRFARELHDGIGQMLTRHSGSGSRQFVYLTHVIMPIRVLIADDHAVVRKGIVTLLEDETDIDMVGQAADGDEALSLIPAVHPDVLLLDITMPRLSGIEVTKRASQLYPNVKTLIFSMHDNPDYVLNAVQSGAAGYLLKDTDQDEILRAVRAVAGGDLYYPPPASSVIIRHFVLPRNARRVEEPATVGGSSASVWRKLTPREAQILNCLTEGMSRRDIAQRFDISPNTVANQRASIIRKAGVKSTTELISVALRNKNA